MKANRIYSNTEDIKMILEPFTPQELPEDIANGLIDANPKVLFLGDGKVAKAHANKLLNKVEEVEKTENNQPREFSPLFFLENNRPLTKEKFSQLEKEQLFLIAEELDVQFPKNIGSEKLIDKILEKIGELEAEEGK